MESIDLWRLSSSLTLVEAAYLILDLDPTPYIASINEQPGEYPAVFKALKNDIVAHRLAANLKHRTTPMDDDGDGIDWNETRVTVSELKEWLQLGPFRPKFFFQAGSETVDYLDRANPQFSPKLAAAVEAWQAIKESRSQKDSGKSVKTDIVNWLKLHAGRLGLTADGRPNNQAIEEVAKVSNWDPKGGAPKTPGN
jgi:hypothetical protein